MSTISSLTQSLNTLIKNKIHHSVFIWGAPGIGKSTAVRDVAKQNDMELVDLRISQLAPTDLRGLPYVEKGMAKFAPPTFLPQEAMGYFLLMSLIWHRHR